MKEIVLYGAGGFGREVASIIDGINAWAKPTYKLVGFIDDSNQFKEGMIINGYPYLGKRDWLLQHKYKVVCNCTIGNSSMKAKIQTELMEKGVTFETIKAYGAFCGPFTKIGNGCVLYGAVNISVNCIIGNGVLLNQAVEIGHDTVIGDYTTIMPGTGISGNCAIGSRVNIGGHAFIVPGRKVGDDATIAAGSIVFSNVKANTTVLGNPAKRFRALED